MSGPAGMIEIMFEVELSGLEALRGADDAAVVVAAIEECNRLEAAAGARRLAAIAELTSRRCDKQGKRAEWACDGWDAVAAEVACALGVRHNKASSQMSLALAPAAQGGRVVCRGPGELSGHLGDRLAHRFGR